jgi:putative oxidoreductase
MLLALIFVIGGYNFLMNFGGQADMLENKDYVIGLFGILPGVLMAAVGLVLKLGGGVALLLGWRTRCAALALIIYTLLATLMFHVGDGQLTNALKNIALIGGLVYAMAAGPGAWAIGCKKANEAK